MAGSMRERSKGVWELRVYAGRDPVTKKPRSVSRVHRGTERSAGKALAGLVTEVGAQSSPGTEATFGVLLERWLVTVAEDRSPTTFREYRRQVDRRVMPALGAVRLSDLTAEHLDSFYRSLRADGLSPASVGRYHALIRRALNVAVRWDWVGRNVATRVEIPAAGSRPVVLPSTEAVAAVMAAALADDVDLWSMLLVTAALGARRGEMCGLRWPHVDLEAGTVLIGEAVVRVPGGSVVKGTKTHAAREVSIDAGTVAVLVEHRARLVERARVCGVSLAPDGFVWSRSVDGSAPTLPDTLSHAWARVRARVPDAEGVRLHDLRHWSASMLLDAGMPMSVVSERLGHRQESTTRNIYSHGVEGRDREAADVLGGLLHGPRPAS